MFAEKFNVQGENHSFAHSFGFSKNWYRSLRQLVKRKQTPSSEGLHIMEMEHSENEKV
jgi:hypothetical protein